MNFAIRTCLLRTLPRVFFYVVVISTCCLAGSCPVAYGQNSSSIRQTGKISGVRRALRGTTLYTTRYSRIHDFDVYFSLRVGQQTYCGDYETVVLDEISELLNAEGKNVEIVLDEKKAKVTLYTPRNRRLKARIVKLNHCSSVSLAQNH